MLPASQWRWELVRQEKGFAAQLMEAAPVRAPGPGEVLMRVHASSLNRRDVAVLRGFYPVGPRERLVPLSDGAGEIVAVGAGVTRVRVGDRVAAIFFQRWLGGRAPANAAASALGGGLDGMLAQYVTLDAEGVVPLPAHLSYEEGATLPCAAVTAWSGLMTRGHLQAGDTVLLQGTGGVSIFGLQFAIAAGARALITSSSDAKLEHAKTLGAFATINYGVEPKWSEAVMKLTEGAGVHHVLEVGGSGTLAQSLASLAPGGHVALIGGLAGFGGDIPATALIGRNAGATGIFVGSRADFEAMNAFIVRHTLRPVVDRSFDFGAAAAAYAYMEAGSHFGKIVIRH